MKYVPMLFVTALFTVTATASDDAYQFRQPFQGARAVYTTRPMLWTATKFSFTVEATTATCDSRTASTRAGAAREPASATREHSH